MGHVGWAHLSGHTSPLDKNSFSRLSLAPLRTVSWSDYASSGAFLRRWTWKWSRARRRCADIIANIIDGALRTDKHISCITSAAQCCKTDGKKDNLCGNHFNEDYEKYISEVGIMLWNTAVQVIFLFLCVSSEYFRKRKIPIFNVQLTLFIELNLLLLNWIWTSFI